MKPILFSTPMVRAILDGRKTQTRRVIKPQYAERNTGEKIPIDVFFAGIGLDGTALCAHYQPGDILWVRETWRPLYDRERVHATEPHHFDFAASWSPEHFENSRNLRSSNGGKWKPSIHMPREAARIFLRVTGVRVERVQDITPESACAEGFGVYAFDTGELMPKWTRQKFIELWNTLYAERGYSWESNPWVWVYEFARIEKPEG